MGANESGPVRVILAPGNIGVSEGNRGEMPRQLPFPTKQAAEDAMLADPGAFRDAYITDTVYNELMSIEDVRAFLPGGQGTP